MYNVYMGDVQEFEKWCLHFIGLTMVQIIVSCLNFNLPKYSNGLCSKTLKQCYQKSQLDMGHPVVG